ncbi:MAG: tetratricopeptide repeat protein [Bacteroidetes bacterium]|nr:tetratricopeptide repeat protein [Bacteroidota bacterium]
MLCRFLFFYALLVTSHAYSQQPVRDSLYNELNVADDNNSKVLLLLEISKTYRSTFPDSAFLFSDSALSLANKTANQNLQHLALLSKGVACLRQKKYADAEKQITDAKNYFIKTADRFNEAECYKFLSNLCNEQGRYDEGEKYFGIALPLYEQLLQQAAPSSAMKLIKQLKELFISGIWQYLCKAITQERLLFKNYGKIF